MRPTKYDPKVMLPLAKKLGREGVCVTEAAERMGISVGTFSRYERTHKRFAKAAAQIRLNSRKFADLRYFRLLCKTEEQLLKALAHVRQRREKALSEYRAKFGSGNG